MTPFEIMATYRPGSYTDDWDWQRETADMLTEHHIDTTRYWINRYAAGIVAGIEVDPILLGNDGRVWDGHHRIVAAWLVNPHMNLDVVVAPSKADTTEVRP